MAEICGFLRRDIAFWIRDRFATYWITKQNWRFGQLAMRPNVFLGIFAESCEKFATMGSHCRLGQFRGAASNPVNH
jgi:hypothetical protein